MPEIMGREQQDNPDVLKRLEEFYLNALAPNTAQWAQCSLDARTYAGGDANLYSELYGPMPRNKVPRFSFNHTRPVVSSIEGFQRLNRKQLAAKGIESSDDKTAEQHSKVLIYLQNREHMGETFSEGFKNTLITGISWFQVYMDYKDDPIAGDIRLQSLAYSEVFVDPFYRKKDLSDCGFILKRSYVTKNQLYALLPDKKDELDSIGLSTADRSDPKFQFMPESFWFTNNGKRPYVYDEFYYQDTRERILLVDPETNEQIEWKGDRPTLKEFLAIFPDIQAIDQTIPTVKLAIVVNGRLMYNGHNGISDKYPFVPCHAYFNPELLDMSQRCQGVVRALRDPQFLYNHRMTAQAAVLDSTLNSGYLYKENSVVDPLDLQKVGMGGSIALKDDAMMTDVRELVPPHVDPSAFQVAEGLKNEIPYISGVSEEAMGLSVDDKAGILAIVRQKASHASLEGIFDNLDLAMKLVGDLIIDAFQRNYTPGKIRRILNEEPTQEFYNLNFGKYDCVVEDAVLTSTQRQLAFAQYMSLVEMGFKIPEEFLFENMTIQNKTELIEAIKKSKDEEAQAAQQAAQAQQQLQAAQARQFDALSEERYTRSIANLGLEESRKMEAVKDLEQAKLNRIKALSELESMDIDKIKALIEMAKLLETPVVSEAKSTPTPKKPLKRSVLKEVKNS